MAGPVVGILSREVRCGFSRSAVGFAYLVRSTEESFLEGFPSGEEFSLLGIGAEVPKPVSFLLEK